MGQLQINPVKVALAEGGVTLWTLSLSCVITEFQAVETEDVIALVEDRILLANVAHRAGELLLVHADLFF